jgi:phosphoribosylformylglycinamidine cyclo-ligase
MENKPEITYKDAGVDIDEGERLVDLIRPMAKRTFRPEVLADIGSFGALFGLDLKKYPDPVLASGTDGVGTKLKIAFMTGKHDTVGMDLVAMCVNDILTLGAEPLFFLDYFATGRLKAEDAADVVKGIADGCSQAGASLIGGETAEMPGFYPDGEYDLSGFAVGVVNRPNIVNGSRIEPGDVIVGVASSGIHSNGFSLVRKVFFDVARMDVSTHVPELGSTLGAELLKPTYIYVKPVLELLKQVEVKGMCHVTGGGIPGNLPRVLPEGVRAEVEQNAWEEPPVFDLIRKLGRVPEEDMRRTFNLGIGYILVVKVANVDKTLETFKQNGYHSCVLGRITQGERGVYYV